MSKDFCTPVINEVCSGSQEESFGVGLVFRKTLAIAHCFYTLKLLQLL